MSYIALYRKYRSKNFYDLVGQEITLKILSNSIKNNQLSHAYLFFGPRGTGKTSIAKIFSRTVNCFDNSNAIPCEKCDNCLLSKNNESVDIIEIDAASNNGVDEIRELKNNVTFLPAELKYKVYIIDEVHMLSSGAFNALLKTLEEPPNHVIFILATTEFNKVPSTIVSRCQTLEFYKINNVDMKKRLNYIVKEEKMSIDDAGVEEIISYANGSLRDAIGILEKANSYADGNITSDIVRKISGNVSIKELKGFVKDIEKKDLQSILSKIDEYYISGIDFVKLLNSIIDVERTRVLKKENNCSILEKLVELNNQLKKSENHKLMLEIFFLSMFYDEEIKPSNESAEKVNENVATNTKTLQDHNNNNDFKNIRVGNTLCFPDRDIIKYFRSNWERINDLAFDKKNGNIAKMLISDTLPVAASERYLILTSKLNGLSEQLNKEIDLVEDVIDKVFDRKIRCVFITEKEWKNYTEEYKKNKEKFKFVEEEKKKEKRSLTAKAKDLFEE